MRKLVYVMNASLDGFIEGPDGDFNWLVPDEEVMRFHGEMVRSMGALLYGRRMYQTMAVWQTLQNDPTLPAYSSEYGEIWRSRPKIVFSRTLQSVGPGCRLVSGDPALEVARLKEEPGGDLALSGSGLASSLGRAGLIDEYRIVLFPVMVGGGKPYFADNGLLRLGLRETRVFGCGAVYLRYSRAE